MNLKSYDKLINEKQEKHRIKALLQLLTKPFKALNWGFLGKARGKLSLINKVPISFIALMVVLSVSIVILVANQLRYEFFTSLIVKNFPEAVTVPADSAGRPLYMSALDRMFAEFEAEVNVGYFLFFIIGLRTFLKKVWLNYNPRKRQVFI